MNLLNDIIGKLVQIFTNSGSTNSNIASHEQEDGAAPETMFVSAKAGGNVSKESGRLQTEPGFIPIPSEQEEE